MPQQLRGAVMNERGGADADAAETYASLCAALWDQRTALETVLFKLATEQLVVGSGATRWLNRADAELREAVRRMRLIEVSRAVEVEALSRVLGCSPEATLRELAAAAAEPWSGVLAEHRDALRALVAEIEGAATENRRLLDAGAKAVQDTLDHISRSVGTYDASGAAVRPRSGPFLIDEQA